ncbi:MAG: hypothetical protein QM656_04530 [Paracoccaceae bacterium]
MPNVKIYVDDTLYPQLRPAIAALLPDLRALLCRDFGVDIPACQFGVIGVMGLPDQPPINAELSILPRPDRTREAVLSVAESLRAMIGVATGQRVAIRISTLDAAGYVALK